MQFQTLMLFIPACFAINMAFGPNNLLSITIGARHGMTTAVTASVGRLLAFAVMICVAALGMGAVLTASEMMFTAMKWAGAAYLVWIGVRLLQSRAELEPDQETIGQGAAIWPLFRREFLVAAGNPKAILVFTAFFPQFVEADNYWRSFAILGGFFLLFEMVSIMVYSFAGARLRTLTGNAKSLRWVNRVSGSMMVAFGIALAFTRRPAA